MEPLHLAILPVLSFPVVAAASGVVVFAATPSAPCQEAAHSGGESWARVGGARVHWCWVGLQEYQEQGRRETTKALRQLQEYCRDNEEVLDSVKGVSRYVIMLSVHSLCDHTPSLPYPLAQDQNGEVCSQWEPCDRGRASEP